MTYVYRIDETLPSTSIYYNNSNYDMSAALSSTNHYPYYANFLGLEVKYTLEYGITQMPLPTFNTPFLLNFTGASLGLTLTWHSMTQNDVAFLLSYFPTANPSARIVVDLTEVWGGLSTTANTQVVEKFNMNEIIGTGGVLRFAGVVNNFNVSQKAGQILWDYSMTIDVGLVEG